MSRIGKIPVKVPKGVKVSFANEVMTVEGPKGKLSQKYHPIIKFEDKGEEIIVSRPNEEKQIKAFHGLYRNLLNNMVIGVTDGYSKLLEINGTGYRAVKSGNKLTLTLGYSHPVEMEQPAGITFDVPSSNVIIIRGIDKELVGQTAAVIRTKRPPEVYRGKGIKYVDEHIRRKEGKTGK